MRARDPSEQGFSVIGKLLGPKGSYLKHITQTTQARVELRGKGSRQTSFAQLHGLFLEAGFCGEGCDWAIVIVFVLARMF